MKCLKSCAACLLALTLLVVGILPVAAYEPANVNVTSEAALVVDMNRDIVVFEKNADTKMYPASLTKIMTAVVVLDECADLADVRITATYEALDPLYGTDSSIYGLDIDEEMTALDLLSVMMIQSANDAANVLAYHFGDGDIDAFIEKMNKKATDLGMTGTHFTNAHGLHHSDHYTTARDMYTLTKYAMAKPLFKEMVTSLYYVVPETNTHYEQTVVSTVFLQDPDETDYYYEYAAGVKTGYTDPAGLCLVSTAEKDGTAYACIVLKCPTEYEGSHFVLSKALYEWAYESLEYRTVHNTETIVGNQAVTFGKDCETVPAVLQTAVEGIVPKNLSPDAVQVQVTWNEAAVTAPITKGQVLGSATVTVDGKSLGTVDVVSSTDVKKSNWKVFVNALGNFFSHPVVQVALWIIGILLILFGLFVLYCLWLRYQNRKRRRRRAERRRRMEEEQRKQQQNTNPYNF